MWRGEGKGGSDDAASDLCPYCLHRLLLLDVYRTEYSDGCGCAGVLVGGGGGHQCRPWSDAALCGIWSVSILFAQACLSKYFRNYDIYPLSFEWRQYLDILNGESCETETIAHVMLVYLSGLFKYLVISEIFFFIPPWKRMLLILIRSALVRRF